MSFYDVEDISKAIIVATLKKDVATDAKTLTLEAMLPSVVNVNSDLVPSEQVKNQVFLLKSELEKRLSVLLAEYELMLETRSIKSEEINLFAGMDGLFSSEGGALILEPENEDVNPFE